MQTSTNKTLLKPTIKNQSGSLGAGASLSEADELDSRSKHMLLARGATCNCAIVHVHRPYL